MSELPDIFVNVMENAQNFHDIEEAFQFCRDLYENQTALLIELVKNQSSEKQAKKVYYPYIGLVKKIDNQISYYGQTITQPKMLKNAYLNKLKEIVKNSTSYQIFVGYSLYPMSLAFVCEDSFNSLTDKQSQNVSMPCISRISKGMRETQINKEIKSIGFFHAEHIDYCLNRLHHYCGSHANHFQNNIVFTNYNMYIDFFITDGKKWVDEGMYESLVGPNIDYSKEQDHVSDVALPQMPAYHLKKANGDGITIINVGVGPSNSKNITDHLAVLSPKSWLMLGHCAGLKSNQKLGDYVLAQNYGRYDNILDKYVSNKIPIPSSAEITHSLEHNVVKHKFNGEKVHKGAIITTADRNWEFDCDMVTEFIDSKAIAIDMESATVATNAFRFSVPCSSFLCISDMPLHGKLKLRGMAKNFYQTKVRHHFNIGIAAIRNLYEDN